MDSTPAASIQDGNAQPSLPDYTVDIVKLAKIESSWNPNALNQNTKAAGLTQITPVTLDEWNRMHPHQKYLYQHLFHPEANLEIANWYANTRIPQMLKAYGLPVTLDNILASYNWGVGNVQKMYQSGKQMPKETRDYLAKYRSIQ